MEGTVTATMALSVTMYGEGFISGWMLAVKVFSINWFKQVCTSLELGTCVSAGTCVTHVVRLSHDFWEV